MVSFFVFDEKNNIVDLTENQLSQIDDLMDFSQDVVNTLMEYLLIPIGINYLKIISKIYNEKANTITIYFTCLCL